MEPYAVFVGDVALDEYYEAERWPGIKEKIGVEALAPQYGGMIANAACVYASMGRRTLFAGVLNSGAVTQMLLKNLQESGVETSLVSYDEALPDSKTIIILAEGEHTVFIPAMHVEHIDITAEQLAVLAGAAYIYSTANDMRRLRCGAMGYEEVLAHVRAQGAKIVYDLDVGYLEEEDEHFYQGIDIAIFNEAGFARYAGGRSEAEATGALLSYGTEAVVITQAEQGCVVYGKEGRFTSPALPAKVVDVTGAGDTFCACFMYAWQTRGDLRYAARFANTAAGICTESVGARAGAVGEAAVLDRMKDLPEG